MSTSLSIAGRFIGQIGLAVFVIAYLNRHIRAHPKTDPAGIAHGRVNLFDIRIALVIQFLRHPQTSLGTIQHTQPASLAAFNI
jgi:hypothetical protein